VHAHSHLYRTLLKYTSSTHVLKEKKDDKKMIVFFVETKVKTST